MLLDSYSCQFHAIASLELFASHTHRHYLARPAGASPAGAGHRQRTGFAVELSRRSNHWGATAAPGTCSVRCCFFEHVTLIGDLLSPAFKQRISLLWLVCSKRCVAAICCRRSHSCRPFVSRLNGVNHKATLRSFRKICLTTSI